MSNSSTNNSMNTNNNPDNTTTPEQQQQQDPSAYLQQRRDDRASIARIQAAAGREYNRLMTERTDTVPSYPLPESLGLFNPDIMSLQQQLDDMHAVLDEHDDLAADIDAHGPRFLQPAGELSFDFIDDELRRALQRSFNLDYFGNEEGNINTMTAATPVSRVQRLRQQEADHRRQLVEQARRNTGPTSAPRVQVNDRPNETYWPNVQLWLNTESSQVIPTTASPVANQPPFDVKCVICSTHLHGLPDGFNPHPHDDLAPTSTSTEAGFVLSGACNHVVGLECLNEWVQSCMSENDLSYTRHADYPRNLPNHGTSGVGPSSLFRRFKRAGCPVCREQLPIETILRMRDHLVRQDCAGWVPTDKMLEYIYNAALHGGPSGDAAMGEFIPEEYKLSVHGK